MAGALPLGGIIVRVALDVGEIFEWPLTTRAPGSPWPEIYDVAEAEGKLWVVLKEEEKSSGLVILTLDPSTRLILRREILLASSTPLRGRGHAMSFTEGAKFLLPGPGVDMRPAFRTPEGAWQKFLLECGEPSLARTDPFHPSWFWRTWPQASGPPQGLLAAPGGLLFVVQEICGSFSGEINAFASSEATPGAPPEDEFSGLALLAFDLSRVEEKVAAGLDPQDHHFVPGVEADHLLALPPGSPVAGLEWDDVERRLIAWATQDSSLEGQPQPLSWTFDGALPFPWSPEPGPLRSLLHDFRQGP